MLRPGGHFLAKAFQGGTENALLDLLKRNFRSVRHVKPPASRDESVELYLLAKDFKGRGEDGARAERYRARRSNRFVAPNRAAGTSARQALAWPSTSAGRRIAWPDTELPASRASPTNGMAASAVIDATIMKAVEKAGWPSCWPVM